MSNFLDHIVRQTTAQIPSVGQKDKMHVVAVDGEQQNEARANIQQEIPSVGHKKKLYLDLASESNAKKADQGFHDLLYDNQKASAQLEEHIKNNLELKSICLDSNARRAGGQDRGNAHVNVQGRSYFKTAAECEMTGYFPGRLWRLPRRIKGWQDLLLREIVVTAQKNKGWQDLLLWEIVVTAQKNKVWQDLLLWEIVLLRHNYKFMSLKQPVDPCKTGYVIAKEHSFMLLELNNVCLSRRRKL
uniref:Uncharacterized protein n=1 Tax=Globodera rostochiensis TaxID=31243 RepID=A0A914H457_GLORO